MELDVHPKYEPKYKVGDKVWIIRRVKEVEKTSVASVTFELMRIIPGGPPILVCSGYKLNTINNDLTRMDNSFLPYEIYRRKKEAKMDARWRRVKGLNDNQWLEAIGDREKDETLDSCELLRCCANISRVRDLLIECREKGGLIQLDIDEIKINLEGCSHWLCRDGSRPDNMANILKQLGI